MNNDELLKECMHTDYSDEELELLHKRSENNDPTLTLDEVLELTKASVRNCVKTQEYYKKYMSGDLTEIEVQEFLRVAETW